jgi:hypothetical protein
MLLLDQAIIRLKSPSVEKALEDEKQNPEFLSTD